MDNVEMKFTGGRELRQRMLEIGPALAQATFVRMVLAGAVIIANAARERAPTEADAPYRRVPGTLKRSITAWIVEQTPTGAVAAAGVPRRGPGYAVPVEFGHVIAIGGSIARPGRRDTGGSGGGHVAARPFLRTALDEKLPEALAAMARVAAEDLETLAARGAGLATVIARAA